MKSKTKSGYTLVELIIVVAIISILASIVSPRTQLMLDKAHQSKAKGNLASIRASIGIFYSNQGGVLPLQSFPTGFSHQATTSLSEVLAPEYISHFPVLFLKDLNPEYLGNGVGYDRQTAQLMAEVPHPKDVYIADGDPMVNLGLQAPLVYDNTDGDIYINNENLDLAGDFFFGW